ALNKSLELLEKEGIQNVFKRHENVARYCRDRIREMGLKLFPEKEEGNSPTVTAVYVPENWTWEELDVALRKKGVVFGGSYEKLAGKIFRIGHMGTQADMKLVKEAMDILEEVIKQK